MECATFERSYLRLMGFTKSAVTAAFSLVIYYWALAVSLPAEQIARLIREGDPEEEALPDDGSRAAVR